MTIRIWISVVAIGASLGLASLSAHDEYRFVGAVVEMDEGRDSLTIKDTQNGQEFTVKIGVTASTPVEKEGKTVARADLKPGTYVVVDALGDDTGPFDALVVKIVPPPAKASSGRPSAS